MKKLGKKILALFMALMCLATVGVVTANAKTTAFDKEYNKALKSARSNSATFNNHNWTPSINTKEKGQPVRHSQNLVTGEERNTYYHPKAGYSRQFSISVDDNNHDYAYKQVYGVKNGSHRLQKIGHAQRFTIDEG